MITCEHASNALPVVYRPWLKQHTHLFQSHRAYDPGALAMAQYLAHHLQAPLFAADYSRLLVDLNRSPNHPKVFSFLTQGLSLNEQQQILLNHYFPHRESITQAIHKLHQKNARVLHLAIHSFTPILRGTKRRADIGLLYDPQCAWERNWCKQLKQALSALNSAVVIRCNYPYLGTSNCLATALRRLFTPKNYAGIEIEINQKHVRQGGRHWQSYQHMLYHSILDTINN